MTKNIWSWTAVDHRGINVATIYSRSDGKVIAEFKDIDYRTAHKVNELLDVMYQEGVAAGKAEAVNAMNRAVDAIAI